MRISFNTQNFEGYKNLIHTDLNSPDSRFLMMSLQLFDDEKNKDLSYYKNILELNGEKPSDVLTFTYVKNPHGYAGFALNDTRLLWGEELKWLEGSYKKVGLSKNQVKQKIEFNTKAYTLLASLTRRLMNISMVTKDKDYTHTFLETRETLKKILTNDEKSLYNVMQFAMFENKPFQKLAVSVNRAIAKTMQKFFM